MVAKTVVFFIILLFFGVQYLPRPAVTSVVDVIPEICTSDKQMCDELLEIEQMCDELLEIEKRGTDAQAQKLNRTD